MNHSRCLYLDAARLHSMQCMAFAFELVLWLAAGLAQFPQQHSGEGKGVVDSSIPRQKPNSSGD